MKRLHNAVAAAAAKNTTVIIISFRLFDILQVRLPTEGDGEYDAHGARITKQVLKPCASLKEIVVLLAEEHAFWE
jgi:hypothetical protein